MQVTKTPRGTGSASSRDTSHLAPAAQSLDQAIHDLGPAAEKAMNSPVGRRARRLVPDLASRVQDLTDPARMHATFSGAKTPGEFRHMLHSVLTSVRQENRQHPA